MRCSIDGSRPVFENRGVGANGNIGINQRSTTQAVALNHCNITMQVEFIQSQRVGNFVVSVQQDFRQAIREAADWPLPASFENADGWLWTCGGIGQARGSDRSAV